MPRATRWVGLWSGLGAGILAAGCSVVSIDLTPRIQPLVEETVEGQGAAKILLVEVAGVLTDDAGLAVPGLPAGPPRVPLLARLREQLKKAADDDAVKALVVRVNSPGGGVTASELVHREIALFREQRHVPVVAALMDVAASGGYLAALAADTIVASPTTVTGSIGTLLVALHAEGLLDKLGLSATTIKSGERKDMGSPFRRPTDEERAIFQGVIDEFHARFVAHVAERRRLPSARVRELADGRIYTAAQAHAHGLVDRVGYLDEAIADARRAAGLDEARVVVYRRPGQYRATHYARSEAPVPLGDTALAAALGLAAGGPRVLYLWWP